MMKTWFWLVKTPDGYSLKIVKGEEDKKWENSTGRYITQEDVDQVKNKSSPWRNNITAITNFYSCSFQLKQSTGTSANFRKTVTMQKSQVYIYET